MKALLFFRSTRDMVKAEASLRERGVEAEMEPAPRAISLDCGMCVEVEMDELDRALEALGGELSPDAVYTVRGRTYVRL